MFTQIPEEVFDRLAMSSLALGFRGQSQERRRPLLTMTRSIVDRETISDRKRIVCSMFQECGIFADFCNQTYCHEHQTGAPDDERNSHRSSWQDVVTEKACFKKCRRSWGMPERQSLVTFLLKAHADQMAHFAKADPAHVAA